MQIGGVDNLVLKQVTLPSEAENDDKKTVIREAEAKEKEKDEAAAAKDREDARKAEETAKSVYGDVVGESSDGDTTRVKKDAMEALETGMVIKRDDKENDLMEYNRDQLTVMLDKGDITKNQYNHEITRRDEIMEKDEKSAFAKTNAEMIEKQKEDAQKKAQEKAKERLDEIQGKDRKTEGETGEKTEEKTNENTAKLENGMNRLAGGEKGLLIEEDMVEKAAETGRSDVIDQILNPEDGNLKVIIK